MKVIAFNGSPKMDKGNTALILGPFLEGLREAGAEVELFYTKKLNINPCQGEFNCWLKTPGKCHQEDDMQMLHPKMRAAEVWVFASPVYVWGVTGPLKNLMDRVIPLVQPAIYLRAGHCSHPLRSDTTRAKVVLVSNCGFWEMDNFDPLLAQVQMLCRVIGYDFAGALLRPAGPLLAGMLEMGAPVHDVLEAARDAGRQLARQGAMSPATLAAVSRELMPLDMYLQLINHQIAQLQQAGAAG
jgi:multimeric flavodoxin WrbA